MTEQAPIPPPVLDCARVIEYAVLNASVGFSGRTSLFVDGKELGRVPCLAICEDKGVPRGVVVLHCDLNWTVLGCAGFGSVAEAKERAEHTYPGLSACWVHALVSEEETERYLDELFRNQRCSFCGRRADHVKQLLQRSNARICDRCVAEFHATMNEP
jgi:hypothetical protein